MAAPRMAWKILALSVLLSGPASRCFAGCVREDVDHYLEKGFTQDQIAGICSGKAQAPRAAASPALVELSSGIDALDVFLSTAAVGFTRKECVKHGGEDLFGFEDSLCLRRRYTLELAGMKIAKVRRRVFLFGKDVVVVRGRIRRDVLDGWGGSGEAVRREVGRKLESGDETAIPVRSGFGPARLAEVLRGLIR